MTILERVRALFAEETPVTNTVFVKTKDGQIFLVKDTELKLESEVVLIDETGTEQAIENGDYTLEDGSTITITEGKLTLIKPLVEEMNTEVAAEVVKFELIPAGEYTLDNGDSITVDENQVVVNWIKAETEVEEPVVEEMKETKEFTALKAELSKIKSNLEAKEKELTAVKESFDKLKKQPATTALDTRKFEKTENKKESTLLSKVREITKK